MVVVHALLELDSRDLEIDSHLEPLVAVRTLALLQRLVRRTQIRSLAAELVDAADHNLHTQHLEAEDRRLRQAVDPLKLHLHLRQIHKLALHSHAFSALQPTSPAERAV